MTRKPVAWELLGGCMALGIALFAFGILGATAIIGFNYVLTQFPSSWVTQVLGVLVFFLSLLASMWLGLRVKRAINDGE